MTKEEHILSTLGLAKRAGMAQGGEFLTEKAIKDGKARLVLIATDSSNNTKKKFSDMCTFYDVPYREFAIKDQLGHAIGAEFRASVTVNNEGFAKKLLDIMEG